MKCDELKPLKNIECAFNTTTQQEQVIAEDSEGNCYGFDSWEEVYLKDEVDAAIAELKEQLESEKASRYADSVDAGIRERRLRRALYKACANWAICEIDYWRKCLEHVGDYFDVRTGRDLDVKRCEKMIRNWINSKSKCIKKAEKYK